MPLGLGLSNFGSGLLSNNFSLGSGSGNQGNSDKDDSNDLLKKLSKYGPLLGLGATFLGGILDDSKEQQMKLQREQLAQQQAEDEATRAENARQFNLNFGQKQLDDSRNFGFNTLADMAQRRQDADKLTRRYNFRNALMSAARGQ